MIEVKNVSVRFKDELVLDGVSLNFEVGKIYGIQGKNGSGKSVLFKVIAGFLKPDSGEVIVNREKLYIDKDFPEECGVMIESPGLIDSMSGFQNLKYLASINKRISDGAIRSYMELFDLDPTSKKKVKNYSLGMRQKLGIIQAVMEDQRIVLLDEPMNSLDEKSVDLVRDHLLSIKKDKVLIITSHNREDLEYVCDDIYRLAGGVFSFSGTEEKTC